MSSKGQRNRKNKAWIGPSERDMEIYSHVCDGNTTRDTAAKFSLTSGRITQICQRIDQWVYGQHAARVKEIKSNHTTRLMHLYQEAMTAWEKSKLDAEVLTVETSGEDTKKRIQRHGQAGDPRFLAEARDALFQIREIWGANEPEKVQLSGELAIKGENSALPSRQELERILQSRAALLPPTKANGLNGTNGHAAN